MANPFVKSWNYLMAAFGAKVDEYADPKVQIQQAIEEARRQHQALSQQAASVIGNQKQLEMKLNRQLGEVERLRSSARQALVLAEEARNSGDEAKAGQFDEAAEDFATQLVTAEGNVEDLKQLHDQSLQAAEQAKQAVERNKMTLEQKLSESTQLLSQLEQAKMQEQVASSLDQLSGLAASGNTPSLSEIRDKIEKRYATALGSAELSGSSVQGRMLEVEQSTRKRAGADRLDEIRNSLHGGSSAAAIDSGSEEAAPSLSKSAPDPSIRQEIAERVRQHSQQTPEA
jgi:phage shock protein A